MISEMETIPAGSWEEQHRILILNWLKIQSDP